MKKQLLGKICIMVSSFLLVSSQLYAQQDSIFFKDSLYVLYSNGIFKTIPYWIRHWNEKNVAYHNSSGIWSKYQDSLIRLKSFDEYKCEVLNFQAYYDSMISDFETVVYNTNGDTVYFWRGVSLFKYGIKISPGPYCDCHILDTAKYNHFVFVVRSKWNYEDLYIDQIYRITPNGLKWVKSPEQ